MVQIYRPENQSAVLITFIIKQKNPSDGFSSH